MKSVVLFILRSSKRVLVTVVGLAVLLGGIVMMITPGPGILGIVAGLAILATEYAWARRALQTAKEKASETAKQVKGRRLFRRGGRPSGAGNA